MSCTVRRRSAFAFRIASCVAVLAAGCSEAPLHDLEAFVAEAARPRPSPISPPPAPPEAFEYEPGTMRDPFDPPAGRWDVGPEPSAVPDLARRRTMLEQFSVTELRMIGVLARPGRRAALVRDPRGRVHRVQAGDYLGRDFGRIEQVAVDGLRIVESIADGGAGWVTRTRTITLSRTDAGTLPEPADA